MWLTEAKSWHVFLGVRRYAGRLLPRCHWAPSEQKQGRSFVRRTGRKNRLTADLDIVLFTTRLDLGWSDATPNGGYRCRLVRKSQGLLDLMSIIRRVGHERFFMTWICTLNE
ncbi:hypothetical protein H0G86_012963 [Trichoderma simmonsii]|uniref:Uncharacterized protein n=1 Tax=Trichoderma simmonsii TaxID=1491479 RepID=A0A8G0PLN5_9HYPO|nr:hypothetical protein H0G86_012963 [Trichoderma simmonsii]